MGKRKAYDRSNTTQGMGCGTIFMLVAASWVLSWVVPSGVRAYYWLAIATIGVIYIASRMRSTGRVENDMDNEARARAAADNKFYEQQRDYDEKLRVQREQIELQEKALDVRERYIQQSTQQQQPAIEKEEQAKDMNLF